MDEISFILGFFEIAIVLLLMLAMGVAPALISDIIENYYKKDTEDILGHTVAAFVCFILAFLIDICIPKDKEAHMLYLYILPVIILLFIVVGIVIISVSKKESTYVINPNRDAPYLIEGLILYILLLLVCCVCFNFIPNIVLYLRIGLWVTFGVIAIWYILWNNLFPAAQIKKYLKRKAAKKNDEFEIVCAEAISEPVSIKLTPQAKKLAEFLGITKKELTLNELECGWYKFREKNHLNSSASGNMMHSPAEAAYQNLRTLFE